MDAREWVAEGIDKLIAVEMRPQGFLTNIVHRLYMCAREQGGGPLAWSAANALVDRVGRGDVVYIGTGHVHPEILPNGETDGPPGAAALARAIRLGLGARTIVLSEPAVVDVMHQTCRAVGLMTLDVDGPERLLHAPPRHIGIMPFPLDADEASAAAHTLCDTQLGAVITIEKIGPNDAGVYNTGLGNDVSADLAKIDLLVDEANLRGAVTIGIGDLGNEIGFGRIFDDARAIVQTPRIVTTTLTEYLIVAGCSNWGAYGIAAALAVLLRRLELAHTAEMEEHVIIECCRAGAVDGLSGGPTYEVDGLHYTSHVAMVKVLNSLVVAGLSERKVERHTFETEAD